MPLTKLTPKQKEYIKKANRRWNIKHGATRSGKTYLDYYLIPLRINNLRHMEGQNVLLGNTRGTLQRNIIEPMQAIYGTECISSIRADNSATIFGERVWCLGADRATNIDRIRGMSIKYCYGDEIATWNPGIFEMLKSRLDKSYSLFEGTTNPRGPNHWLKRFIDSDADIFSQHYSIDDNPFLDAVVKNEMKKEYSGVYYDRFILGCWVLAEGLIYPMYQDALADPPSDFKPQQTILSIDYGTQNAFAALVWQRDKSGVWYAVKGYYYSGRDTGRQKTDADYGDDIDALISPFLSDRKIKTIIDPSAASFIALLKRKPWCAVIPAENAVMDGIRDTATAIQRGSIKISPSIREWQDEAAQYVWDDKLEDKPVKVNDHYMDATRYFVETLHINKQKSDYKPLWTL